MVKKTQKQQLEEKYNALGKLSMQIGKQAEICNKEQKKLQALQQSANDLATEIDKLDAKRSDT